jgi:RNA polymerase sigma factor (sigma-70 family)
MRAEKFAEKTYNFYAPVKWGVWTSKLINCMQPTDRELLIACRRGDHSSWEKLVDRYQRLIYTIPRRAGLNEEQAGDVFQEVFVTLYEKVDAIEDPDRLHAWLVTTARRKTWRWLSKERSLHAAQAGDAHMDEEAVGSIADTAALPDEILMRLEQQHLVRLAVNALDRRCRELLTMLYYQPEPAPYAEIAAALGTSEGSIGPTRARCLKKLLQLLEK